MRKRPEDMTDEEYARALSRQRFLGWCIKHELLVRIAVSVITALVTVLIWFYV